MDAVARGVQRKGGVSIGILPEADRRRAAPDLTYTVCSAMGYARNLSVVASGDVVIALGGAWGTLSEIALARNVDKPVILLDTWSVTPPERRRARRGAAGGHARRGRRARPHPSGLSAGRDWRLAGAASPTTLASPTSCSARSPR